MLVVGSGPSCPLHPSFCYMSRHFSFFSFFFLSFLLFFVCSFFKNANTKREISVNIELVCFVFLLELSSGKELSYIFADLSDKCVEALLDTLARLGRGQNKWNVILFGSLLHVVEIDVSRS